MNTRPDTPTVHLYSQEEIDVFLGGDHRAIDRLLMEGLNNISAILIHHIRWEEEILASLGTHDEVSARILWINTQIEKQKLRNAMMRKVSESTVTWALIAFLGFAAYAIWQYIVANIQHTWVK